MFYCDPCARDRGWPETLTRSDGTCECCQARAVCNAMASRYLPMPRRALPPIPTQREAAQ